MKRFLFQVLTVIGAVAVTQACVAETCKPLYDKWTEVLNSIKDKIPEDFRQIMEVSGCFDSELSMDSLMKAATGTFEFLQNKNSEELIKLFEENMDTVYLLKDKFEEFIGNNLGIAAACEEEWQLAMKVVMETVFCMTR